MAGAKVTALAASAFTLSWMHSVEKIEWQEDWRLTDAGLVVDEARVKGTGAGMEPPEGARLEGGWWRYRPQLPALPALRLAVSDATSAWQMCTRGVCFRIAGYGGSDVVVVKACDARSGASLSSP